MGGGGGADRALIPLDTCVLFTQRLCQGQPLPHAVTSPTLRGQWDLILIILEEKAKKQQQQQNPNKQKTINPSTSKILENIKSSKEFMTPNCTLSFAPQSGEKGRETTNDFREKVEACHEPEVNLS